MKAMVVVWVGEKYLQDPIIKIEMVFQFYGGRCDIFIIINIMSLKINILLNNYNIKIFCDTMRETYYLYFKIINNFYFYK